MGGPELPGDGQLPVVEVHGDDRVGAGQARPGDRRIAHAATAEHGHGISTAHVACVHGGPQAGHHAAADQACHLRTGRRVHLRGLAGVHQGLLGEGADAQRRRELDAVQGHLLRGVVGGEAVPGATPSTRPALAADRPPVQDHEVAGGHVGDAVTHLFHDARGLMAEQEGELVVDGALAVVEVRVADPAGLHGHQDLARARIRHLDGLYCDRLTLGSGHHGPDAVRHDFSLVLAGRSDAGPRTAGR